MLTCNSPYPSLFLFYFSDDEREASTSLNKIDSLSHVSTTGDKIVQSLVNIITVDIPDTFKKIFTKGKSMREISHEPHSISTRNSRALKPLGSLQSLDDAYGCHSARNSTNNRPKGFSLADLDTRKVPRKLTDDLPQITEVHQSLERHSKHNSILPGQGDEILKLAKKPISLPHNSLHQNMKNSVNDRLLPRKIEDSPEAKNEIKRAGTGDNEYIASSFRNEANNFYTFSGSFSKSNSYHGN